jgi:hypothetical protein
VKTYCLRSKNTCHLYQKKTHQKKTTHRKKTIHLHQKTHYPLQDDKLAVGGTYACQNATRRKEPLLI